MTTGINDPRVAPWQAAKMAARLQAASSSGKPVLLRIDYDAGHGVRLHQEAASRAARGHDGFPLLATWHQGVWLAVRTTDGSLTSCGFRSHGRRLDSMPLRIVASNDRKTGMAGFLRPASQPSWPMHRAFEARQSSWRRLPGVIIADTR